MGMCVPVAWSIHRTWASHSSPPFNPSVQREKRGRVGTRPDELRFPENRRPARGTRTLGRTGNCISHWSYSSWAPGYLPTAWIWAPDTYWVIRATQQAGRGLREGPVEAAVCPAPGAKARRPDHGVHCLLTTPSGDHRLSSSQHQALGRNRVLFPPRRHVLARTSLGLQPCWSWPLLCHWPLGVAAWAPREFLAW